MDLIDLLLNNTEKYLSTTL